MDDRSPTADGAAAFLLAENIQQAIEHRLADAGWNVQDQFDSALDTIASGSRIRVATIGGVKEFDARIERARVIDTIEQWRASVRDVESLMAQALAMLDARGEEAWC